MSKIIGSPVSIYSYEFKNDYYRRHGDLGPRICFGAAINGMADTVEYTGKYVIVIKKQEGDDYLNKCLLNKAQFERHLNEIGKLSMRYSNLSYEESDEEFKVNITISGRKLIHKCILFWIRCCYDFPYNMFYLDALEMDNHPILCNLSLENRLQLILNSTKCWYSTDQSFFSRGKDLMPTSARNNRVKSKRRSSISRISDVSIECDEIVSGNLDYSEFWLDAEERKKRIEVYCHNFLNIFK